MIGTTIDAKFEMRDGVPMIVKMGKLLLPDDKVGKPAGIYRHIGRRMGLTKHPDRIGCCGLRGCFSPDNP